MTILEAIKSHSGLSDIADDFVSKVLIDRSVDDGSANYTIEQKKTVELCVADCYVEMVNSPDFSEGKFSVKLNRSQLLRSAQDLYWRNGEASKANKLLLGKGNSKGAWW